MIENTDTKYISLNDGILLKSSLMIVANCIEYAKEEIYFLTWAGVAVQTALQAAIHHSITVSGFVDALSEKSRESIRKIDESEEFDAGKIRLIELKEMLKSASEPAIMRMHGGKELKINEDKMQHLSNLMSIRNAVQHHKITINAYTENYIRQAIFTSILITKQLSMTHPSWAGAFGISRFSDLSPLFSRISEAMQEIGWSPLPDVNTPEYSLA